VTSASILLGAVLLGVAGCGQSQPPAQAHSQQVSFRVLQRFSQCVRDHGVDWPDPQYVAQGRVDYPPNTPGTSHLPQAVQDACSGILSDLPADALVGASSPRPNLARLGRFAGCMRIHGLEDWPDPDANGVFHLPPDLQGKDSPRSAQIKAAASGACGQYNPSGSFQVAQ
jgi:hypothetical protein